MKLLILLLFLLGSITSYSQSNKFRFSGDLGYAVRTSKFADGLTDEEIAYLKDLRGGFKVNFEAAYFINSQSGIGLAFNNFTSTAVTSFSDGFGITQEFKEKVLINYYGIEYISRMSLGQEDEHHLYFTSGLGYMIYKDDFENGFWVIEGDTLGIKVGVGYDYVIDENFGIGAGIYFLSGVLRGYDETIDGQKETIELEEGQYEGLANISFNIGVRFYL